MSLIALAASVIRRARARKALQCQVRRLSVLSDHLLADIGVTRADLLRMDREAFGWPTLQPPAIGTAASA